MAEVENVRNFKLYKSHRNWHTSDFESLFRSEEYSVKWLTNYFSGNTAESRGGALSSSRKNEDMFAVSRVLGLSKIIGEELGVSQGMVSLTVHIVANADNWVKFPYTENEILQSKELWQSKYCFPTAIVVMKGNPTSNVHATCNGRAMFKGVH
ncbi:hypothetical protein PR048_001828, partial [Dryococelus australis]